jgi:hypothetical protein
MTAAPAILSAVEAGRIGSSGAALAHDRLRPSQQAVRPRNQHDRHDQELGDQGQLGEIHRHAGDGRHPDADAQRLDLADDHRGEVGSRDRAHAAYHHDHEGVADDDEVGEEVRRLTRDLQRAAEAGEQRTEREHDCEQRRLVHAERADHLAVLGGRAHEAAEAGLGEREVERDQHQRADEDEKEVVARQPAAEHVDRAAQAGRARAQQVLRPPQPQHRVADHQHEREGGEQLKQFRRAVDAPQQHDLDCGADEPDQDRRRDNAAPEPEPARDARRDGRRDVGAQHVKRAMGDVDDAGDAEDERQSGGDQKQTGGGRQPVESLEQQRLRHGNGRGAARAVLSWRMFFSANRCPLRRNMRRDQPPTGRSFLTSASEGSTAAPSTYLKSTMIGLPSLSAVLPT